MEYCLQNCISLVPKSPEPPSSSTPKKVTLCSTSFESPETLTTPIIPPDKRALQDVFSKQATTSLAMGLCHRPTAWGKAAERQNLSTVFPGTEGHGGVHRGGSQRFIRPSTSSAGSSFFFVGAWRLAPHHRLT